MAEIYLTNTLTRKKEKFKAIKDKEVGIYTCGPTVYRDIHIGNLRTYLMADILKRVLIYNDISVKHITNITDVGHMRTMDPDQSQVDPVIAEALKQGKTPQQIAKSYTKTFLEDEKKLNILPADIYPKATEYIKEMIELIQELINKGYAYVADGNVSDAKDETKSGKAKNGGGAEHKSFGTVYFDVKKFKKYGQLSGNILGKMDKLLEAVRVSTETDKKDSVDFALWKSAEKDRTMKWDSPWGEGFPGWHIECSAMALKHLTNAFKGGKFYPEPLDSPWDRTIDIHTGGEDNVFPHHEAEIAQSEAVTGKKFVSYWIHAGFLLVDGKKMARREGNVYTISDIVKRGFNPLAFRYLALTVHYRSRLNFTWKSLDASENALNNLYREITGYATSSEAKIGCAEYEQRFEKAVNDDMGMPSALSITQELIDSDYPTSAKLRTLFKFDQVLGLDLEKVANEAAKVPHEVTDLVGDREKARSSRDFATADKFRKQIREEGYEVVDTKQGSRLKKVVERAPAVRKFISSSADVESLLEKSDKYEFSVVILAHDSLNESKRLTESVLKNVSARKVEIILVDNGSIDGSGDWAEAKKTEIESKFENVRAKVLCIDRNIGAAAGLNVGLKQAQGKYVVIIDSSVEVKGYIWPAVTKALGDEAVGLVGKWGVVGDQQMHHFHASTDLGQVGVDAIEGYILAFRREDLKKIGFLDEKFRFYRHLDLDFSFEFKDKGLTLKLIDLPLIRHEHVEWERTPPTERENLSKRNFYHFLEKWRDRKELLLINKNNL